MRTILLSICLLLAAALPARAEKTWVALSPIPYGFVVPEEIASHLSTGPLTGTWAEQVEAAGARSSVAVFYQPESGDKTILFTAYDFPADKWDAAQQSDEPPPSARRCSVATAGCCRSLARMTRSSTLKRPTGRMSSRHPNCCRILPASSRLNSQVAHGV